MAFLSADFALYPFTEIYQSHMTLCWIMWLLLVNHHTWEMVLGTPRQGTCWDYCTKETKQQWGTHRAWWVWAGNQGMDPYGSISSSTFHVEQEEVQAGMNLGKPLVQIPHVFSWAKIERAKIPFHRHRASWKQTLAHPNHISTPSNSYH